MQIASRLETARGTVWVRNLQFIAVTVEVQFTYQEPNGTAKEGTVIIPGGSWCRGTIQATLDSEFSEGVNILGTTYAGTLSFDIFMGKGTYPKLWVVPELLSVDIALDLVLTTTPEVDLLANIQASLEAKLASYIGEQLEFADLAKYIYIDYVTGRAFSGINSVSIFDLPAKDLLLLALARR